MGMPSQRNVPYVVDAYTVRGVEVGRPLVLLGVKGVEEAKPRGVGHYVVAKERAIVVNRVAVGVVDAIRQADFFEPLAICTQLQPMIGGVAEVAAAIDAGGVHTQPRTRCSGVSLSGEMLCNSVGAASARDSSTGFASERGM